MRTLLCVTVFITSFLIVGCSGDPELVGRNKVQGQITMDGKPIELGDINFGPAEGATKPGGGARIIDGKFLMEGRGGLHAGQYRVSFTVRERIDPKTGQRAPKDFNGDKLDLEVRDLLPKDFNENNVIMFEVVDKKTNTFDYDIKTK